MGEPLLALRALPRTLVQLTETDISLQIHRERGSGGGCGSWARASGLDTTRTGARAAVSRAATASTASRCSGSIDSFAHPITSPHTVRASAPWRTTWITSGSRMMRCCVTPRAVSHLELHDLKIAPDPTGLDRAGVDLD